MKTKTIIESPYAGTNHPISSALGVALHIRYLRACMRDSLLRGEAPFASHGLYTQPGVLDDLVPEERTLGIEAGFAWREAASITAIYTDMGISPGMQLGAAHAEKAGARIEERSLGAEAVAAIRRDAEVVPGFVFRDGKYSVDDKLGETCCDLLGVHTSMLPRFTREQAEAVRAQILEALDAVPR